MLKPQRVTFNELTDLLCAYEQKYGYSTIEFYRRYRDGELGDDDLMMWAGLIHLCVTSLPACQLMQSKLVVTSSRPVRCG